MWELRVPEWRRHMPTMTAIRLNPNRKAGSVLMFIFVSSPRYYILDKRKTPGCSPGAGVRPDLASLPKGNDDNVLVQELGQPRIFSIHDLTECIAASQGHVLAQDILYSIDLRPGCDFNNISQAISTSTKAKALAALQLLQCLLGGMLGSLLTCDPAANQKIGIRAIAHGSVHAETAIRPTRIGARITSCSAPRPAGQARQMAERRESPFAAG